MTKTALIKLLILVILAFIICLPEFFKSYRALKVSFVCLPYQPCQWINVKKVEDGKIRISKNRRDNKCDPPKIQGHEKWEQACEHEDQRNTTDSRTESEDQGNSWFMCETDLNMSELKRNISSSGQSVHLEVSVNLQLRHEESTNLTLYGYSNHSSLYLDPFEEDKDNEKEKVNDDKEQLTVYYCCPPASTKLQANQSYCLLWLSNHTVTSVTAKEELPRKRAVKDEWRCVFRVLWLTLLCVVLLTVILVVLGQIYRKRRIYRKKKRHHVGVGFTGLQLNGGDTDTEDIYPRGTMMDLSEAQSWSGLSPIQEVDIQDDIETLLDGNVDNIYTVNLHHRGHPSTISPTKEQ